MDKSDFSVDIMIDGSSSRKNSQEFIAAQVYVLAKSLERCIYLVRYILIVVLEAILC